ncbi:MAG: nuclear transport factor 2 family protein [Candidatus Aminicenantes bacterium]|nr:nuclear transport factor 2 family protein [Candidatus Aminicenantes bacterium]
MSHRIESLEQFIELWTGIYNKEGKPDWSHILPFYDGDITFRDSIQTIHGLKDFAEMTERLTDRSKALKFLIHNGTMDDKTIFIEWEMILSFKKYPQSSLYGASRITLNDDGRIIGQRDYFDLWGDIFDNIPRFGKLYRKFMRNKFG